MSLVKTPLSGWNSLTDFFDDEWMKSKFGTTEWSPAINMVENDSNFEIEVAAPGMKKDEFEVKVENGVLVISGKSEKEAEEKEKNYTRKEFSSRSFTKRFTLPENVNEDEINAKHEDGVLKLTLNKTSPAKPSKTDVKIE